jgi:hypothetical protein
MAGISQQTRYHDGSGHCNGIEDQHGSEGDPHHDDADR